MQYFFWYVLHINGYLKNVKHTLNAMSRPDLFISIVNIHYFTNHARCIFLKVYQYTRRVHDINGRSRDLTLCHWSTVFKKNKTRSTYKFMWRALNGNMYTCTCVHRADRFGYSNMIYLSPLTLSNFQRIFRQQQTTLKTFIKHMETLNKWNIN